MTQSLSFGDLKGGGIVAVLFIMGVILIITNINIDLGQFAIKAAVFVAVVFAFLGIYGIINRYKN